MMNYRDKTKDFLIKELEKLHHEYDSLKKSYEKDISKYMLIEKTLRESEAKYRLLFENSGEAILLTNPDGSIYSANPEACKIFGISEAEICKIGRSGVVDLDDPRLKPALNERKKTGKVKSELNCLRMDGTIFPAEVNSTVFMDTAGNEMTSMIVRDISERKQFEKELHLQSEIMKNINEGISLIRSEDEIIVFTNPKFDEMFGYDYGELIGKQISIVNAPTNKSPEETKQDISDIINITGEWHGEILNIKKNGDHFWCSVNVSIFDHSDYGWVYIAVHSDITKRKIAESALEKSEAGFRNLFENSLMAISVADTEGHLVQINQAYAQMFGYQNTEEMLHEITNARMLYANKVERQKIAQILHKKGFFRAREVEMVRRDGSLFFVMVSASEIRDSKGQVLYNVTSYVDLTERRKMEDELRNSKELLEKLNQHLTEIRENERLIISREIHDELGQSMTALKLDLNQMHKYVENNPEAVIKLKSMIELVSETIKDVQRISSDLRPGILDDLGLAAAIEWYSEEFENRTGIKCRVKIDDSMFGDSQKNLVFFRILQEALTNVIRHANASWVIIILHQSKQGITMTIQDNGIGIPEEKIESYKSLGLISMRERVRQFDGKFVVSSKEGKGTKLTFFIPK